MLHAFCMYIGNWKHFGQTGIKWSNRQGISKAYLTKKCCILWLQSILLWHFQEVWGKNWLLSILKFNLRLDRVTVVRYGKWMGPISKADVVNCDQFVTNQPPAADLFKCNSFCFGPNSWAFGWLISSDFEMAPDFRIQLMIHIKSWAFGPHKIWACELSLWAIPKAHLLGPKQKLLYLE